MHDKQSSLVFYSRLEYLGSLLGVHFYKVIFFSFLYSILKKSRTQPVSCHHSLSRSPRTALQGSSVQDHQGHVIGSTVDLKRDITLFRGKMQGFLGLSRFPQDGSSCSAGRRDLRHVSSNDFRHYIRKGEKDQYVFMSSINIGF